MPTTTVTIAETIDAPIEAVFDFVVAEDVLPKVLLGYGPLPRVVHTSDLHSSWEEPGVHRTVHLADGSTAREEVTDFRRPHYFAYNVSQFTFALRHLATEGRGQWRFTRTADGTRVEWIYTFTARSPLTYPLLLAVAQWLWRGYMRVGLRATKRLVEGRRSAAIRA